MFFVWIMTFAVVSVCVALHYEMLSFMAKLLPKLPIPRRRGVMVAMLGVMLTHVVEMYLFAVAMYIVEINADEGRLIAGSTVAASIDDAEQNPAEDDPEERVFADAIYLSFTTYTSLGYGDIIPLGDIRILAAVEVLVGLLTIAWSASFMFMEMTELWRFEP